MRLKAVNGATKFMQRNNNVALLAAVKLQRLTKFGHLRTKLVHSKIRNHINIFDILFRKNIILRNKISYSLNNQNICLRK
jgi:hypothetical protein